MRHLGESKRWRRAALGMVLAIPMVAAACTGGGGTNAVRSGPAARRTIPQPAVPGGVTVAPDSARVDLALPTFSHPTAITNPLFPVAKQRSVLMLGHVDGKPFRTEVTLLPETLIIEWQGMSVRTAVSQYNAFLDGRIDEIAYDYYAQADDGSVWYFGEDVFDFRDGAIVVTEGTWRAGRDGEAAMIMPGHPKVGDVYRSENAPGFVFEEVTVQSVGTTVPGPLGPVSGAMVGRELHSDGTTEDKEFAPGYGEFSTSDGKDLEALAMAVPTDALPGGMPADVSSMTDGALAVLDAADAGAWSKATANAQTVSAAWQRYRSSGDVPTSLRAVQDANVHELTAAVRARRPGAAQTAAIQAARSGFDLQLRFRPAPEVDLARMDLWAAQLVVDVNAHDLGGVGSDQFALDYVRDRVRGVLGTSDLQRVNDALGTIQIALVDEEYVAAAKAARELRATLATATPKAS
ncbi:MAG TPA: hypothetical protein VKA30_12840 [Actinomycetota bacterium]|nr:hypothetical protein [Actinomycetota bacterium]